MIFKMHSNYLYLLVIDPLIWEYPTLGRYQILVLCGSSFFETTSVLVLIVFLKVEVPGVWFWAWSYHFKTLQFEFLLFFQIQAFFRLCSKLGLVSCTHFTLLYAKYCIERKLYIKLNQGLYRYKFNNE
jgi:hypothetical protein